MDFYHLAEKMGKNNVLEIYPDFRACRSKDLMIRGKAFYAIWDAEQGLWSTDEYDVQRLVDRHLEEAKKERAKTFSGHIEIKRMISFSSNMWKNYRTFLREMSDNAHQLDENLTFQNTPVKKGDYVSRRLPYSLEAGSYAAYDELIGTLYEAEEREKLEWAIGAIVAGDARYIQKFIVLYGEAGSGKSTFLNIVQKLFEGYYTTFEAKALTGTNNSFSTEPFKANPLVAIQHDGDLSRIEDNTKLNSLVAHEEMVMNEKYKPSYTARSNAFLFIGTNKPVKITDSKSGIIRRLIDVRPSGKKVPVKRYHTLMSQIEFELGAIAWHCLQVYRALGKNHYSNYRPLDMMYQTDVFFNFVEAHYDLFKEQDGVSLSQAYALYKVYCDEALVEFKLPRHKFREELKGYFESFDDVARIEGRQCRSYYTGFRKDKFTISRPVLEEPPLSLVLDHSESRLDVLWASQPAQYAGPNETPLAKWSDVRTTLSEIDTRQLHYVLPPQLQTAHHIVIDFDLKDDHGQKSLARNLEAASLWPPTYAEFSKSGAGLHLHYLYLGNVQQLNRVYDDGIEVKVFTGNASLRRKFSKANNVSIATLRSGLPLKGAKEPMINFQAVQSERSLREQILKNLNKEVHPATKPSIDFIWKILEDAYKSGLKYDVTDLRPRVLAFANNSTNQAEYCVKLVPKMHFKSEEPSETPRDHQTDELIFFDVEVFPNLFVVCWKAENKPPVKMINPSPQDIEALLRFKLVGFNCRRYDNHILYARYLGYDNEALYQLSQKIIKESRNALFGEAYNLSYTDVYDFSSKKQSLKKFQIELGLKHQELGLKWDAPVPENQWLLVADYCVNDVITLQAVFEARKQDFIARLILADISGLTPNDTTQMHTARIIFGNDKHPQSQFIYTDLSEEFPGYTYDAGQSSYRGEDPGEGGYVYAEPGMYANVAVLDVASMHPTSLVALNLFGDQYTKNFKDLLDARIAIKRKDYDRARTMLNGILANYLTSDGDSGALSYALKIVINIVYGLTSAKFENKFRDPRNKDNIVAKRGALFMIDLKHAVQKRGYTVAHIKTDSIKIPEATPDIISFVMAFGKQWGYTFEHEVTYDRFCLVNDAVYIARANQTWTPVGAQFAHPYVFKTLFSKELVELADLYEVKTVTTALYLDMNETLGEGHNYRFVGKAGVFLPVKPGRGGGLLCREKDGKYYAAVGSKGYRWLEAKVVESLGLEDAIDYSYYYGLVDAAIASLRQYGDLDWFLAKDPELPVDDDTPIGFNDCPPWEVPCGREAPCFSCRQIGHCKLIHEEDDEV